MLPLKRPMELDLGLEGGVHAKLAGVDCRVFWPTQKSYRGIPRGRGQIKRGRGEIDGYFQSER